MVKNMKIRKCFIIMILAAIGCSSSQNIVLLNDKDYKIPKTSTISIVSATSASQNRIIVSGLAELLAQSGHKNIMSQDIVDKKYLSPNETFPLSEDEVGDEVEKIYKVVKTDCIIFIISDFATVNSESYMNGNSGTYVSVPVHGYIFSYPIGVCVGEIHYIPDKSRGLFSTDDETVRKLLKQIINNISGKLDEIMEK